MHFYCALLGQFCYFRALTTASIFKGFQNYLSCLRKQAEIQISDQKDKVPESTQAEQKTEKDSLGLPWWSSS